MTQAKTVSIRIKTDQSETGGWSWVCVIDDVLEGVGVGEPSREEAQRVALELVNSLLAEES